MENYFKFKKVWKFSPEIQIGGILVLYIVMVVWGYFEYQKTGLIQGYPARSGLFFVPIYEEVIFRGVILGALIKSTSVKKAIIYSSILFALWHLKNLNYLGLEQILTQMAYSGVVIGPLFAYITIKTKTIWPGVILHYLNNIWAPVSWILLDFFGGLSFQ